MPFPQPLSSVSRWRDPAHLAVLSVLVAGITLRFVGLTRQSLWDDEMLTVRLASLPASELLARLPQLDGHPPLFHLQLHFWTLLFGSSLAAFRANAATWGSLALIAFYRLLKQSGISPAAVLAGTSLLALSPLHLAYSQEIRPYSLAIFLSICGFFLLEKARTGDLRQTLTPGLVIVLTLLLFTHYWGLFVGAAECLVAIALIARRRQWTTSWAILIPWILFGAWVPMVVRQAAHVQQAVFWVPQASFLNLIRPFGALTSLRFEFASALFFPWPRTAVPIFLGTAWAALALAGLTRRTFPAWLWLGLGLGIPFVLSFRAPSVFVWYRYPSLLLPAFLWMVAGGIDAPRRKALPAVLTLVILAGSLAGVRAYFTTWEKANPKSVMAYVNSLPSDASVVVRPAYFAELANYYSAGGRTMLDEDKMLPDERARLQAVGPVVLIAFDALEPVTTAFLNEFHVDSSRYFPGTAHLGITVYLLSGKPRSAAPNRAAYFTGTD